MHFAGVWITESGLVADVNGMGLPYDPVQRLRELKLYHLASAIAGNNEVTVVTRTATYVIYFGAAALNVTVADDGTPRIVIGEPMSRGIVLKPQEIIKVLPGAIQSPSLPGLAWERKITTSA